MVVAHPVVGSGLETLLRLEDRYEVRRVPGFAETAALVPSWLPDLALVDGVLVRDGARPVIGVPTLVLSGSAVDGERLRHRLDDARGWLRKDPTPEELRAAIDRVLARSAPGRLARPVALAAVVAATVAALILAWGYLTLQATV